MGHTIRYNSLFGNRKTKFQMYHCAVGYETPQTRTTESTPEDYLQLKVM